MRDVQLHSICNWNLYYYSLQCSRIKYLSLAIRNRPNKYVNNSHHLAFMAIIVS